VLIGDDPEWKVTGTLAGYDRLDEFERLPPTLVVSGRYDRLTPPSVAYETFEALAPERRALHVFERSAHRPWAEQPDEYFDAVKSFLGGHWGPSASGSWENHDVDPAARSSTGA
jgi:proline iminopeptidase